MAFQKGDILIATKRGLTEGHHYIIYLAGDSKRDFVGAIITTKSIYDNVKMLDSHFLKNDQTGKDYKIQYNNSHLVIYRFIKPREWAPYEVRGRLSNEGIKFVDDNLKDCDEQTFANYYRKLKS